MERRQFEERREAHVFVSDERREGPYDRRGAGTRRLQRELERQKIERIQAFKEKDKQPSSAPALITQKRLVFLGLALLIIVVAVLLVR